MKVRKNSWILQAEMRKDIAQLQEIKQQAALKAAAYIFGLI